MKKIRISKEWLFKRNGMQEFQTVDLPHDLSIGQPRDPAAPGRASNGFFPSSDGTYIKYMTLDDRRYILDIDGAYMCAEVWLNDNLLGMHPHGYAPYLIDLTDKVRVGRTNKLKITTKGLQCSTRWYSGGGVYRDVFLWEGGSVRIEPRDVFIVTESIGNGVAVVRAEYAIASDIAAEADVLAEIRDAQGNVAAKAQGHAALTRGEKSALTLRFTVENPLLWDTENPNLYTLYTQVLTADGNRDVSENTFGIRTISADAVNGFRLNGKTMKLRGGCIHHDHGVLGAAAFPAAEWRKVSLLKKAGFNALRIAHNPPSLALLETCDRLGMIVMDEAFDMWRRQKTESDYHLWFADWWDRDIAAMVLRDRNHPCVVSYSIGNEIYERDGNSDGAIWAKKLADEIRKYDATKFVTSGICGLWKTADECEPDDYVRDSLAEYGITPDCDDLNWAKRTEGYMAPLDIVGYNYAYKRYARDHEAYPNRVIWGSETHAIHFYESWNTVMASPFAIGDFTWTAYDNLGEAGTGRALWARDGFIPGISLAEYPWRTCYQGDLDLCGYRRPQSYFREAVWLDATTPRLFTTHPEHYGEGFSGTEWHWYDVLDTWTYPDAYLGKPVKVDAYTAADEVEFFLNGQCMGRIKVAECVASIDIPYEKGELSAVAYRNGSECGRYSLRTVGQPAAVTVVPERDSFAADMRDLCYFDITVVDADGNRVPHADNEISCLVDGGELLGIFSGDPKNEDMYTSNTCHAFQGRALAIVRTNHAGEVRLTVGGRELASGTGVTQGALPLDPA